LWLHHLDRQDTQDTQIYSEFLGVNDKSLRLFLTHLKHTHW
jgi:hypothetical protein